MPTTLQQLNQYFATNQLEAFLKHVDGVMLQLNDKMQFEKYIHCALNKATAYFRIQNFTMASLVLSELFPIFNKHASTLQKIRYYNTLAAIEGEMGNIAAVFQYLSLAQHLAEKKNAHFELIQIYHNLSTYYYEMNDYQTSLLYAQKCHAYRQRFSTVPNETLMVIHVAKLLLQLDNIDEAKQLMEQQKTKLAGKNQSYEWVHLQIVEATLLTKTTSLHEAYAFLLQALQCVEALSWRVELYEHLCMLSKQFQPLEVYLADLKQYTQLSWSLLRENRTEQVKTLRYYLHEDELKEVAWIDPLTSVYNRRFIEENYAEYNESFVAFLFDIDHFKSINDTYGHLAGDVALQNVAAAVNDFVHALNGHFVRLGGDEFFGLFTHSNCATLSTQFSTLLHSIRQLHIFISNTKTIQLTISIGVVFFKTPCSLQHVLQHTDEALYVAKQNGRNQFHLVDEVAP